LNISRNQKHFLDFCQLLAKLSASAKLCQVYDNTILAIAYFKKLQQFSLYSCRQVYKDIKPKKRMAARSAAILFLGLAFALTQSTAAIKVVFSIQPLAGLKK
jgi:hypothetical protein